MIVFLHFLIHWSGSDYGYRYGQFQPYDFLSGVAGLSIFGLLAHTARLHNCHERGCPWPGRLPVGEFRYCEKHYRKHSADTK